MTKRFGFTLAEVLITLGIIYKKALSVISQAVVLNLALDDYDLGTTTSTGTGSDDFSMFNLIKNRTNVVRTETGAIDGYSALLGSDATSQSTGAENVADTNYTVFFNDGIMFTFPKAAQNCTEDQDGLEVATDDNCRGFIDVNGTKAPNRQTVCSDGAGNDCVVDSPADIYPVVFYDQGIYPATAAGKAVLYKK